MATTSISELKQNLSELITAHIEPHSSDIADLASSSDKFSEEESSLIATLESEWQAIEKAAAQLKVELEKANAENESLRDELDKKLTALRARVMKASASGQPLIRKYASQSSAPD